MRTFFQNPIDLKRLFALHTAGWSIFIAHELLQVRYTTGRLEAWYVYGCYYSINIVFFYAALLALGSTEKSFTRYLRWMVNLIALTCAYLVAVALADSALFQVTWDHYRSAEYRAHFLANHLNRSMYFLMLAIFYRIAGLMSEYRKRSAINYHAYLRQQINPHLQLNALNLAYSQVIDCSPVAARTVWLLAELTRFGFQAGPEEQIPLNDELQQLLYLTELNDARFRGPLNLEVRFPGNAGGCRIIPLVLLTLTENIFKHGLLSDPERSARLTIDLQDGQLVYHSFNHRRRQLVRDRPGAGLDTTRVRLDHAYGRRYQLQITQTDETFDLKLILPV